ncbi:MAG: hypothetical protein GF307_09490 [candidate division Zixibacteria bacterium]|nr:hypothetical protein [candidate division Zixibacteria bacterium]
MNHIERIDAVLRGEKPDRTPLSFWRHFFHREDNAEGLADAMLAFQQKYDWDFMKVNPRAAYHVEAWGAKLKFFGDEFIKPQIVEFPVNTSSDWDKIETVDPSNQAFSEQLNALKMIKDGLGGELYFVQTVFSPLSIAGDMVKEPRMLIDDMKNNPEKIHRVLEVITQSLIAYSEEVLKTGAAGLFFATTEWATTNTISKELYLDFGKPYDLRVLEAVNDARMNVLHVCKPNNMLELFTEYPFNVLSYADTDDGNMPFDEASKIFPGKAIVGGLGAKTILVNGKPEEVVSEAESKSNLLDSSKWILGPSCSIPPEVPEENLKAVRDWVDR